VAKNIDIKKKQESTNLKRYGYKSSFQNKDVRKKWTNNMMIKHGISHYFKTDEFKEKSINTNQSKYGVDYYVQSTNYKNDLDNMLFGDLLRDNNITKHISKYESLGYKFISLENRNLKLENKEGCKHKFDISYDVFMSRSKNDYEVCTICNNIKSGQSNKEKKIIEWLHTIVYNVIERDREFGVEVDIYLPEYNLAIEFNGLYWHSEEYKDKKYHLNKTNILKKANISLIHIWEDDWDYKQDIVKSIILNKLYLINNKVYARNCKVSLVNKVDSNDFLDSNHIQGKTRSLYNIGLYHREKLVSIMCFNYKNGSSKNDIELVRFCSKIDTVVIGGSSKLFNFFIKKYKFNKIISFSDISLFDGGLYEKLGFTNTENTPPNFWWIVDKKRINRFRYNKSRLVKDGYDKNKTEYQIMSDIGNSRIWGCGLKKWIWYE